MRACICLLAWALQRFVGPFPSYLLPSCLSSQHIAGGHRVSCVPPLPPHPWLGFGQMCGAEVSPGTVRHSKVLSLFEMLIFYSTLIFLTLISKNITQNMISLES